MDTQDAGDGGGGDAEDAQDIGELGDVGRGIQSPPSPVGARQQKAWLSINLWVKRRMRAISSERLLMTVVSFSEGGRFLRLLLYKPCLKALELP